MLFITNRSFKEGVTTVAGRRVNLDLGDDSAQHSVYDCQRTAKSKYTELGRVFGADAQQRSFIL